ncbi:hypothetical protein ACIP93_35530 [Streptomyces sp. NPDC088745]|uniref:hypothetical protein n=1 Tax=Streptomyces sp. NPDC088745 TaxID=3365884 RepID=UPI00382E6ACC
MRKAFTASAITVVTAAALAVPVAAFADAPAPSPAPAVTVSSSPDDSRSGRQQDGDQNAVQADKAQVTLRLSSPRDRAGFRAGESVTITATTSANASRGVTVSSPAFGTAHLAATDASGTSWSGTAVVSRDAGTGTLPVKSVADFGDTGAQTSARILVNTVAAPAPRRASLSLSTDGAGPGDRVRVTIDSGDLKGSARVRSGAFGGTVNLTRDADSSLWHGTATVAANAKPGYDRVDGYVGDRKIDSVKFGIADAPHPRTTPNKHHAVAPVDHRAGTPVQHHAGAPVQRHAVAPVHRSAGTSARVEDRAVPRGAVNAGATIAPAPGADTGLVAGAAGLSAVVLLGGTVLWRRRGTQS